MKTKENNFLFWGVVIVFLVTIISLVLMFVSIISKANKKDLETKSSNTSNVVFVENSDSSIIINAEVIISEFNGISDSVDYQTSEDFIDISLAIEQYYPCSDTTLCDSLRQNFIDELRKISDVNVLEIFLETINRVFINTDFSKTDDIKSLITQRVNDLYALESYQELKK